MAIRSKDVAATLFTALAVLAFAATHESWNVPLIGDSHRWAAGAIFVLGGVTCTLGARTRSRTSLFLAALGVAALVFGVLALVTGSLTALALLVVVFVLLWLGSTVEHVVAGEHAHPA